MTARHSIKEQATAVAQTQQDIAATLVALQTRLQPAHLLADSGHVLLTGAHASSEHVLHALGDFVADLQQQAQNLPLLALMLSTALQGLGPQSSQLDHEHSATAQKPQQAIPDNGVATSQTRATAPIAVDLAQLEHVIAQHPWLLSSLALAVGIGIGVALPETAAEQELYRKASDEIGQHLTDLLQHTLGGLTLGH